MKTKRAILAILAANISSAALAQEVNLQDLRISGVTGLKAVDVVVNRPSEPKATYKVIVSGQGRKAQSCL